jgi:hypothetical protein
VALCVCLGVFFVCVFVYVCVGGGEPLCPNWLLSDTSVFHEEQLLVKQIEPGEPEGPIC